MTRTNLTRWRLTAACLAPCVALAWASLAATVAVAAPDVRVVDLRWEEIVAVQRNGEVEPGEVGRVVVTLENRGDVTATGVQGSIAIVPPIAGVSVISGATTWADLAPGARAEDAGTLLLEVGATVACGEEVVAELSLEVASLPVVVVPLGLHVGFMRPTINAPQWVFPFTDYRQMIEWNGSEYGMTWYHGIAPPILYTEFARVDAAGNLIGTPTAIPTIASGDGPGTLAWGGDRWAFVRADDIGVSMAILAVDGTILGQYRLSVRPADHARRAFPTIAWDGVGWGVIDHTEQIGAPYAGRNELTYMHVLPDGTVDASPTNIDVGLWTTELTNPICWADDEFLVLADGFDGERLIRIGRDGQVQGMSAFLPYLGSLPAIAWSGRGLGIAGRSSKAILFSMYSRDGVAEQAQVPLRYLDVNSQANFERVAMTWDGSGFAISASVYDPTDVFARDTWVGLLRVSETGRAWMTVARTTPSTPEVTYWWLGFSMAWNPVNREYALPVISTDDPAERLFSGAINIQRIGQGSLCMEAEPPREISAPGSGSPLTVSVQIDRARPDRRRRTYVHFEDIGAEATGYNTFMFGYSPSLPALTATGDVHCHLRPGLDPEIVTDEPGRFTVLASAQPESLSLGILYFLVSASNQWGEGPKGFGSSGAPSLNTDVCALSP